MDFTIKKSSLGKLILLYLIILPTFIDWINGFLMINYNIQIISRAYRASIFLIFVAVLYFHTKKTFLFSFYTLITYLFLELAIWVVFSNINIISGFSLIFNWLLFGACGYCTFIVIKYIRINRKFVIEAIIYYGTITSIIIIVSLIFDIGVSTYATKSGITYGFGTQSYYLAGNFLGLSLVVALYFACLRFYFNSNSKNLICIIIIFLGSFSIGTRTGMIVSTLLLISFLFLYVFIYGKKLAYRLIIAIIIIPIIIFSAVKMTGYIMQYSNMQKRLVLL